MRIDPSIERKKKGKGEKRGKLTNLREILRFSLISIVDGKRQMELAAKARAAKVR